MGKRQPSLEALARAVVSTWRSAGAAGAMVQSKTRKISTVIELSYFGYMHANSVSFPPVLGGVGVRQVLAPHPSRFVVAFALRAWAAVRPAR